MQGRQVCKALRLAITGSVLWSSLAVSAPATEVVNRGLIGVTGVAIIVEPLDQEDAECGVTESGVDAAVRLPLDASRLAITTRGYTLLGVQVTVVPLPNGLCVASLNLGLTRPLMLPDGSGIDVLGQVWFTGVQMSGSTADIAPRVYARIEGFTKELIAEWLKANPRTSD